jgi:hypothetical protein
MSNSRQAFPPATIAAAAFTVFCGIAALGKEISPPSSDKPWLPPRVQSIAACQMALQSLEHLHEQQSFALAYFDSFLVFAVLGGALAFLVLLMKRSVAAKGAVVAAE